MTGEYFERTPPPVAFPADPTLVQLATEDVYRSAGFTKELWIGRDVTKGQVTELVSTVLTLGFVGAGGALKGSYPIASAIVLHGAGVAELAQVAAVYSPAVNAVGDLKALVASGTASDEQIDSALNDAVTELASVALPRGATRVTVAAFRRQTTDALKGGISVLRPPPGTAANRVFPTVRPGGGTLRGPGAPGPNPRPGGGGTAVQVPPGVQVVGKNAILARTSTGEVVIDADRVGRSVNVSASLVQDTTSIRLLQQVLRSIAAGQPGTQHIAPSTQPGSEPERELVPYPVGDGVPENPSAAIPRADLDLGILETYHNYVRQTGDVSGALEDLETAGVAVTQGDRDFIDKLAALGRAERDLKNGQQGTRQLTAELTQDPGPTPQDIVDRLTPEQVADLVDGRKSANDVLSESGLPMTQSDAVDEWVRNIRNRIFTPEGNNTITPAVPRQQPLEDVPNPDVSEPRPYLHLANLKTYFETNGLEGDGPPRNVPGASPVVADHFVVERVQDLTTSIGIPQVLADTGVANVIITGRDSFQNPTAVWVRVFPTDDPPPFATESQAIPGTDLSFTALKDLGPGNGLSTLPPENPFGETFDGPIKVHTTSGVRSSYRIYVPSKGLTRVFDPEGNVVSEEPGDTTSAGGTGTGNGDGDGDKKPPGPGSTEIRGSEEDDSDGDIETSAEKLARLEEQLRQKHEPNPTPDPAKPGFRQVTPTEGALVIGGISTVGTAIVTNEAHDSQLELAWVRQEDDAQRAVRKLAFNSRVNDQVLIAGKDGRSRTPSEYVRAEIRGGRSWQSLLQEFRTSPEFGRMSQIVGGYEPGERAVVRGTATIVLLDPPKRSEDPRFLEEIPYIDGWDAEIRALHVVEGGRATVRPAAVVSQNTPKVAIEAWQAGLAILQNGDGSSVVGSGSEGVSGGSVSVLLGLLRSYLGTPFGRAALATTAGYVANQATSIGLNTVYDTYSADVARREQFNRRLDELLTNHRLANVKLLNGANIVAPGSSPIRDDRIEGAVDSANGASIGNRQAATVAQFVYYGRLLGVHPADIHRLIVAHPGYQQRLRPNQ